jgi:hypothetical protein
MITTIQLDTEAQVIWSVVVAFVMVNALANTAAAWAAQAYVNSLFSSRVLRLLVSSTGCTQEKLSSL